MPGRRHRDTIVIVSSTRWTSLLCPLLHMSRHVSRHMSHPGAERHLWSSGDYMITKDEAFSMLRAAASKWDAHNAPRLGASLAYYTLLSLAPLSILLVAICRLVFTRSAAESNLLRQLQGVV